MQSEVLEKGSSQVKKNVNCVDTSQLIIRPDNKAKCYRRIRWLLGTLTSVLVIIAALQGSILAPIRKMGDEGTR